MLPRCNQGEDPTEAKEQQIIVTMKVKIQDEKAKTKFELVELARPEKPDAMVYLCVCVFV